MKLYLLTLLSPFLLLPDLLFSQTVLVNHTFETAGNWTVAGTASPNNWITGTCAGNGISQTGTRAAYITTGGIVPGCGPTGISNYSYANAPSGSLSVIYHTDINAGCASSLQITFDAQLGGTAAADFLQVVYSTDHGTTWITNGAPLNNIASWQSFSQSLPASLDNTSFWVGFRFTYDNTTINGFPPAVDNVKILAGTFTDAADPVITCPGNSTLQLDQNCQAVMGTYTSQAIATDLCTDSQSLTFSQSPAAGTVLSGIGTTQIVTITVTDLGSNQDQCTFTLSVADTVSPVITCPPNQNIYATSACDANLASYTSLVTVTDNCVSSFVVSQSPGPGTIISDTAIIQMSVTVNAQTATCSFSANLIDTIKPVVTCHGPISIYANSSCQAIVVDLPPAVTRTDNCTAASALLVTQTPAIGSFVTADALATMTITDASGNQSTCTIQMIFRDTISPQITCPPAQSPVINAGCDYTVANFATAAPVSDNCTPAGSILHSQLPPAGTTLPIGTHSISLFAQDATGNTGLCSFSVMVTDTTRPVITCPGITSAPANAACIAHVGDVTPLAVATDNCTASGLITFTQTPPATLAFTDTITVQLQATDAQGNTQTCSFLLYAADTVAPVITCLSDTAVAISNPCNYTVPNLEATYTATDGCAASGMLTFQQNPPAGAPSNGITAVSLTVTDPYGNSATCITHVTPIDMNPATITCPGTQTVTNGTSCFHTIADYTGLAGVADNCTSYTVTQSPAPGLIVPAGPNPVTLTVTDAGSNSTSCTFNLQVIETQDPGISCPQNVTSCSPLVTYTQPAGVDNCLFRVVQTDNSGLTSGGIFPIGITTQTYTVIDSSGNSASCSFTVEVLIYPDTAIVSTDTIRLCNTFTTSVTALAPTSGTGSWSVLQGTGIVTSPSALTTDVTSLSTGTNKIVWTVNSPACGFSKDTVVVIVSPLPSAASLQDSMIACSVNHVLIQTMPPTAGTGMWTAPAGATFDDPTAPIAFVSNLNEGTNAIVWTVSSGNCPTTSDTMIIELIPQAHIAYPDTTICLEALPITLTGTEPVNGQSTIWTVIAGNASFGNKYVPSTQLTAASIGNVSIVYYMSYPGCGAQRDTLYLTIQQCDEASTNIPTMFTPNADGDNDFFQIPNLNVNYPGCEVTIYNRWGGTVYESKGYASEWDGNYKSEPVPMGTYFYSIHLNDADETVLKGSISIIR